MKKVLLLVLLPSLHSVAAEDRKEWALSYTIASVWGTTLELQLNSEDRTIVANGALSGGMPCSRPLAPGRFKSVDETLQRLISLRPERSPPGPLPSSCIDGSSASILVTVGPKNCDSAEYWRSMLSEEFSHHPDCRVDPVPGIWLETIALLDAVSEEALGECRNAGSGDDEEHERAAEAPAGLLSAAAFLCGRPTISFPTRRDDERPDSN